MAPSKLYVLLLPFVLMAHIPKINASTSNDARNLLTKLFITDAYNKEVRPIYDQIMAVNVTIGFVLTGIVEFDSQKERLTTSGYLTAAWKDYYLQWDPSNYNGTKSIFISHYHVWKPDIGLQNGVSEFKGLGSADLMVTIESDGSVFWWPFSILQSTCKVSITYFPYDTQTCSLKFTAWSYYKTEVQLSEESEVIILNEYEENSVWTVVGTSVHTLQDSLDATVIFTMKLKRKPLFYLLNVIIPVIMLSVMNACVFVLPAESGEKASFAVTVFLSLAVFLTIVTSILPQNSDKASYLGMYLVVMVAFSTLTVILTVFQLRLNSRDVNTDPIPLWLIKLQIVVERVRSNWLIKLQMVVERVRIKLPMVVERIRIKLQMVAERVRSRMCNKVHPAAQTQDGVLISGSDNTGTKDDKMAETTKSKVQPLSEEDTKSKITWENVCNAIDFILFWMFSVAIFIATVTVITIM